MCARVCVRVRVCVGSLLSPKFTRFIPVDVLEVDEFHFELMINLYTDSNKAASSRGHEATPHVPPRC